MVNRVSSFFPKGGHSATQTELKTNMNTRKVKRHRNSDTKNTGNREPKQNYRLGTVSTNTAKYILNIKIAPIIYQTKKGNVHNKMSTTKKNTSDQRILFTSVLQLHCTSFATRRHLTFLFLFSIVSPLSLLSI